LKINNFAIWICNWNLPQLYLSVIRHYLWCGSKALPSSSTLDKQHQYTRQDSGRHGRHKMHSRMIRVHLTTHKQLQLPLSSSAALIARVCCCCCWLSTLSSTTLCTAVCTVTALPSSFSTTTPVVSLASTTALPSSSITTAHSTRLATPTSLYTKEPHNAISAGSTIFYGGRGAENRRHSERCTVGAEECGVWEEGFPLPMGKGFREGAASS